MRRFLFASLLLAGVGSTAAEITNPELRTPRAALPPSLPSPAAPAAPHFELPALPAPLTDTGTSLADQPLLFLRKVEFSGNTVVPTARLQALAAEYEGKNQTVEALDRLRLAVTQLYVSLGYLNSGAVIPDQSLDAGVLRIEVVEGELTEIEIDNPGRLRSFYLASRLQQGAGSPLNVKQLERKLQVLLDDPLIDALHGELLPGDRPGTARLRMKAVEKWPYQAGIRFDNHLSPSIGSEHGTVFGGHRNVLGLGDAFYAEVGVSPGYRHVSASYAVPLNAHDTRATFDFDYSDSNVVEAPFNALDVASETRGFSLGLSQPVLRSPDQSLVLSANLDRRHSRTFLLDEPFSFSPGVRNGESVITVLRLGQEWSRRGADSVLAARSTFNLGFDALQSTTHAALPDSRYFSWVGQVQWARRLPLGQVICRTDVQLAGDALLPLEKFALGGASSVRGYRENELVRDRGFLSSVEWRIPLEKWRSSLKDWQLAPFVDAGGAWEFEAKSRGPKVLASTGLGLRYDPDPRLHLELYWAHPWVDIASSGDDLQNEGLHFQIAWTPW